jgi:pimeloyl-ACP methyl ester carboxylesterase
MQADRTPTHQSSSVRRIAATIRRRRRRAALGLPRRIEAAILALLILLVCAVVWPFNKVHLQAIAVLDLVANQPIPAPIRALVAEPITAEILTIPTANGPVQARMYTPVHHPNAPAFLVLHGVHHLGMNEPRLVAFASAMASCGMRVLTPQLPDIADYQVGANSIATIGDSARWLAAHNNGRPVGVMGLSFSGGLSLLAAADPAYRSSIRFVVAIGSQDEMSRVATYYRTGEDDLPNGKEESLPPHEYGALVMEYEHLEDFAPKQDLAALRAVLRAHLYEDKPGEDAAIAKLNPQQKTEATELMATTSPATRDLLAKAEAKHVAEMAGVSPHGHLATLTTPVYLLHGEGDNIIPSAETQWMAAELPSQTLQAELISPLLSHLDLDGHAPDAMDRWRLIHFFALILHDAEKH